MTEQPPRYEIAVGAPPREDAFPLYSGLWRAFYDRKFYSAVLHYWRRFWIYYLLLLVVITGLPGLAVFRIALGQFMQHDVPSIIDAFPPVEIVDGKATLPENVKQPVVINNVAGEPAMVIDTTIGGRLGTTPDAPLLLSRDNLVIQYGPETVELMRFDSLQHVVLDSAALKDMIDLYRTWFLPLLIPFGLFVKMVILAMQIAMFAGFGYLMARVRGLMIPYRGVWRLAVVAMTPAMLLQILLVPLLGDSEMVGLVLLFALFGYMWFALDSVFRSAIDSIHR